MDNGMHFLTPLTTENRVASANRSSKIKHSFAFKFSVQTFRHLNLSSTRVKLQFIGLESELPSALITF
jgi:hypothetical protein